MIHAGPRREPQNAVAAPLRESRGRRSITIGLAAEFETHHIVRTPIIKLLLTDRVDEIVGRRDHIAQIAHALNVVEQGAKRLDAIRKLSHVEIPSDSAAVSSRSLMAPFRMIRKPSASQAITVLGAAAVKIPPSRNTLTLFPSDCRAASAVLAGGSPERFALVAVIGCPRTRLNARAIGCDETRMPTPPSGPMSCGGKSRRAGITIVSGPGQNALARRRAIAGTSRAIANAIAESAAISAIGLLASRPLIAKTFSNAFGENGSAA